MTSVEEKLRKETIKWLNKIKNVRILENKDDSFLENINAYISDCEYFLNKGALINAFEAIIWAWAWLEIGERIGILKFEVKEKS